jgi:predicted DNA-binding WGR domain protein
MEAVMNSIESSICKEWQSPTRYYRLEIAQDLFGFWIITRIWRGKYAKNGQTLTISTQSKQDVENWINKIHMQRLKRGYQLIEHH